MDKQKLKEKAEQYFPEHDTTANGLLILNGISYEIDTFEIEFAQAHDFKGEPQQEVKGGILKMTFNREVDEQLNYWMFHNDLSYSGMITFGLFSRLETPPLIISFTQGRCARYSKYLGVGGVSLSLAITAKKISVNGIDHKNDPKFNG